MFAEQSGSRKRRQGGGRGRQTSPRAVVKIETAGAYVKIHRMARTCRLVAQKCYTLASEGSIVRAISMNLREFERRGDHSPIARDRTGKKRITVPVNERRFNKQRDNDLTA